MWSKSNKKPLVIISGPSGVGKSTIVKEILSSYGPEKMGTTITYTTRPSRSTEKHGREYYFVNEEEFISLKEKNILAEWTYIYNHYYGTAIEQMNKLWEEGKVIIKDFDLKGAMAIKTLYPQTLRIFISPPSVEELIQRVRKRSENPKKDMEIRIRQAEQEMEKGSCFDYSLENNRLPATIEKLKKIIEEYLKKI